MADCLLLPGDSRLLPALPTQLSETGRAGSGRPATRRCIIRSQHMKLCHLASAPRQLHRLATALVALTLLLVSAPALAVAADAGIAATATYTDAQVREAWSQLKPSYSGAPYVASPSVKAPYATGTVNAAFLYDGLGVVNFARLLAGVPSDVTLDATRNTRRPVRRRPARGKHLFALAAEAGGHDHDLLQPRPCGHAVEQHRLRAHDLGRLPAELPRRQ